MLGNQSSDEQSRTGSSHFSAELQATVRAELDAMLQAPIFIQSSRCKRFLGYIVEHTLMGKADQLKERTIGIGVFERANDYDTGDDSIVRVTANEVRKRISQFYRESSAPHLLQIELPRGAYVPEFRIQPCRHEEEPVEIPPSQPATAEPVLTQTAITGQAQSSARSNVEMRADRDQIMSFDRSAQIKIRQRVIYPILLLSLAVGVVALGTWKSRSASKAPDLWTAFMHTNLPILVCIDTHSLQHSMSTQPTDKQRFVDLVLLRQIISLDDATILSTMASELGKKGIPFRVVGAEQTTLADLRRQPIILIGAIDNKWTLRLTQSLPFRIEVTNPPGSGAAKEPVASIVDARNPTSMRWTIDLAVPFTAWKADYAIVARIDDVTTGVPVLIEAGLGNDGTVAASELISSGAMTTILAATPPCQGKNNFETVIGTEIIDMKSGPPHVLRLNCW